MMENFKYKGREKCMMKPEYPSPALEVINSWRLVSALPPLSPFLPEYFRANPRRQVTSSLSCSVCISKRWGLRDAPAIASSHPEDYDKFLSIIKCLVSWVVHLSTLLNQK